MLSPEELTILLERLREKEQMLSEEIDLMTSWIAAHQKIRRLQMESLCRFFDERRQGHLWRRISCQLHQRRSELKTQLEKTRTHLHAISQKPEGKGFRFLNFPIFSDMDPEIEPASVDA